ncbi:MAG: heparinase II/III family protein [Gemmatimonadales bacterium]
MTRLLIDAAALDARSAVANGPLAPLAASLSRELEPVLARDLYIPPDKALLSREGGRCARDGALLGFDPFEPHAHRCPSCGEIYRGDLHDRFWIYWYQLWLAERAVHGALLSRLGRGDRYAKFAESILDAYAQRYATYPNRDNVLGPTRLFFSTYLESIWLLQICLAVDLLDGRAHSSALVGRVRDEIVEPSRAIIAEYDEGGSNRQVWNDVALLAAARLLGETRRAEEAVYGPSGIGALLGSGLLSDGTWYEGENYHLFAHRGLWYGVTMAQHAGLELPDALLDRFDTGFAAPFATALPDFTLPSRRDSQYAISLRQWRIAEHCELGVARRANPALLGALGRMYDDDVPRAPTGRATSSADVERNGQPSALDRADLGWRALLCALPELPPLDPDPPGSALLDAQGIAVFRRDEGATYAALDYGHSGGGHGHPDRLNLLLFADGVRWLDDFGTGSYVDPSLHWYRSTLAHNTVLVDGHSQTPIDGQLTAYDERADIGWIEAVAHDLTPGVSVARTIVVMPGYLLDTVEWEADRDVTVDLPLHVDLEILEGASASETAALAGGDGLEDGFAAVHDAARQHIALDTVVRASAVRDDARLDVWATSSHAAEWWRAVGPAAPGRGDHAFRVVRSRARAGAHRIVWSWSGAVTAVEFGDLVRVMFAGGAVDEHWRADDGWRVSRGGDAPTMTRLGGRIELPDAADSSTGEARGEPGLTLQPLVDTQLELGKEHYRRSEQSWDAAGRPAATIGLRWSGDLLDVRIVVARSDLTFVAPNAVNLYDNEPADINGDSVQLYLKTGQGLIAAFLVPVADSTVVRMRAIEGWSMTRDAVAVWERHSDGYEMRIEIPCASPPVGIDVIINEMPRDRVRRRGQLVLSGAGGEWVYLHGDRHDEWRLIRLEVLDV